MVTHPALLVAVQLHPPTVDTFKRPVPPLAGKDWLDGETE
jgi:hypothetical protein